MTASPTGNQDRRFRTLLTWVWLPLLAGAAGYLLLYRPAHKTTMQPINQVEGHAGERRLQHLPDGTTVLANGEITLQSIPDSTAKVHHRTRFSGDALLEVPVATPSVLLTGGLQLTTTGAVFRLTALPGEAGEQLLLLRGWVQVEKAYPSSLPEKEILHAGEMILFNRDIDLMEKETFDTAALVAWKKGELVFTRTPLPQVLHQLEEWFAVRVEWSGHAPETGSYSAAFQQAGLPQVLDHFCRNLGCRYRVRGNRVTLVFP